MNPEWCSKTLANKGENGAHAKSGASGPQPGAGHARELLSGMHRGLGLRGGRGGWALRAPGPFLTRGGHATQFLQGT